MVIAVNTIHFFTTSTSEFDSFLIEILLQIASNNKEHQFVFITDDEESNYLNKKHGNVSTYKINSKIKKNILIQYWLKIGLPSIIKKINPQAIIQLSGYSIDVVKVPQLLIFESLYFNESLKKKSTFYLNTATTIITFSNYLKSSLKETYHIDDNKIKTIPFASNPIFHPLNITEILKITDGFADGRAFFLLIINHTNSGYVFNTLKAFSIFKKWQLSTMKLLIVVDIKNSELKVLEKLQTYKYKDDVIVLKNIEQEKLAKLMAASYCVLYPTNQIILSLKIMQAIQVEVPVITTYSDYITEIIDKENRLLLKNNSEEEIAEKMQLIYKDETLRAKLIQEGIERKHKYNWDNSASFLWDNIKGMAK